MMHEFSMEQMSTAMHAWMTSRGAPWGLVLLVVVGAIDCSGTRQAADTGEVLDKQAVVAELRAAGLALQPTGQASQPYLTRPGDDYALVGGGALQVYEYESASAASTAASRINVGRAGTSSPRVFQRANILVLYFGNDPSAEATLIDILGPWVS